MALGGLSPVDIVRWDELIREEQIRICQEIVRPLQC